MAAELEIKLSLESADLKQALVWLLQQPGTREGKRRQLINCYYDTASADLNRQQIALRVRNAGDRFIQTLKTRGEFVDGAHLRQEWEWPVPDAALDVALLADTPVGQGVDLAALQPVFETNFERRVVMIDDGETVIECAIDSGEIVAGDRRCPLNEVEFELKSGDGGRLLHWARALAEQVPVFLNLVSKAEQGYFLAGLHAPGQDAVVGQAETLDVNRFLYLLSVAWLTGKPLTVSASQLHEIAAKAGQAGEAELFGDIAWALGAGQPVRQLLVARDLGRLQLAIAGR